MSLGTSLLAFRGVAGVLHCYLGFAQFAQLESHNPHVETRATFDNESHGSRGHVMLDKGNDIPEARVASIRSTPVTSTWVLHSYLDFAQLPGFCTVCTLYLVVAL